MERLDFASVMMVLRRNILEESCSNQTDFIYALLGDVNCNPNYAVDFDQGQVCRWLNGLARLSPNIIDYYQEPGNQNKLLHRIEQNILPKMPDSAMAVQELYDLLMQAPNVSQQKKMELTEGFSFEEENDAAIFITEILCLAMQLRFEKRDVRNKKLIAPGNLSPMVIDYIFDTDLPRACRWFLGRTQELEQLHSLLIDHSKVFVHGIPGIGKSELAKAYAKQHGKEYTNVLYVHYTGSLKQAVIDLDFADDLPNETEEARFKRHNRFLRSLKDDTLLIVDNFNVTATQDSFLDVMLKYRCRILFTTRSRYENHVSLELTELSKASLLELVEKFYPGSNKKQTVVEQMIELLHRHTFAVELAARLLANGLMKPEALLSKLEKEKAALDAEEKIGTTKDGRNRKATYYDHIHSLFSFCKLSKAEQGILRSLTLMPAKGIATWHFGEWMDLRNLNTVNDLIEMGLIQPQNDREILLHPMIREVAVEELKPSIQNCKTLLTCIQQVCLRHGEDISYHKQLTQVIENVMELAENDDGEFYLRFLEDAFPCMWKYRSEDAQFQILRTIGKLLEQESLGSVNDRALLLDCYAAIERKTEKAIQLDEEALSMLPETNKGNVHLTANIHANLGELYRKYGKLDKACEHMETALSIMEEYGLTYMNDIVVQINNYAVLLCERGERERGMQALEKLAGIVAEYNSPECSDYAAVQESIGANYLTQGLLEEARVHFEKALHIYEKLYDAEPERIEEKKQAIIATYARAGVSIAQQILAVREQKSFVEIG